MTFQSYISLGKMSNFSFVELEQFYNGNCALNKYPCSEVITYIRNIIIMSYMIKVAAEEGYKF